MNRTRNDFEDPSLKANAQVEKLQRQFDAIAAIDFFKAPEGGTASLLINDLAARLSGDAPDAAAASEGLAALTGKVWVTRENLFVDRMACGWLIRRFID